MFSLLSRGMSGPCGKSMSNFKRNCQTVFQVIIPVYTPTRNVSSIYFTSLATLGMVSFFTFSHSSGCIMVLYLILICISLDN